MPVHVHELAGYRSTLGIYIHHTTTSFQDQVCTYSIIQVAIEPRNAIEQTDKDVFFFSAKEFQIQISNRN